MARPPSPAKPRHLQRHNADPNPPRVERRVPIGATAAEKFAWGRALRAETPRRAHAGWTPAADRPDPVALLEGQGANRVPELVPIRYGRMLASPFAFLRGSALVMAADLKEAPPSVLERYTTPGIHKHQGQRAVFGQRLMQAASDPFLGWFRGTGPRGLDFYVRQLLDGKASVEVATLDAATLPRYVAICAETLARAHARSGHSSAIAGYLGNGDVFDKAPESFGMAYADQTIVDHAALTAAEASGRITARRGI